jgi:hypothetical protein
MVVRVSIAPLSPDPVARALGEVDRLHARRVSADVAEQFLRELDAFDVGQMARFDARVRRWRYGPPAYRRAFGRDQWPGAGAATFEQFLDLVSRDGRQRQRAVEKLPLRPCVALLITIRATDWVAQVRAAALRRVATMDPDVAVELLPAVDTLAHARERGHALRSVLAQRLDNEDLKRASCSPNHLIRRAAWRRLIDRSAYDPSDVVNRAIADPDVIVRSVAAAAIGTFSVENRRAAATALIQDHVGALAARGLEALVLIEGDAPLLIALMSPTTTLRRRAQEWARLRQINAAALYRDRLQQDAGQREALLGLAEIAEPADLELMVRALNDARAPVRTAALRAVAALDPDLAERAAVDELETGTSGKAMRWAAVLLRRRAPSEDALRRVEAIALDDGRPLRHRIRAASVLRRSRWLHLMTLLRIQESSPQDALIADELRAWFSHSATITRAPDRSIRTKIEDAASQLDHGQRRQLEFLLRTASAPEPG